LIFEIGIQELTPPRLAQLLYTAGVDGDDIELGTRHVVFWDALFDAFAAEPANLVNALRAAGSVMGDSRAAIEQNVALFSSLARLPSEDRSLLPLPVTPLEVHDNRLYVADEDEVKAFVEDFIGEDDRRRNEVRVQILNGRDDAPGIGQEVASRLIDEGFNVILSGNAPRLNYKRTLVIIYDSGAEARALAQHTVDLLGTGRVQVSTQDQGIVDLTIVVGKDFQRAP
jgi:NAD(P)-dependent dehydrogenase (short-subunit alcohol dehydrogenase family)